MAFDQEWAETTLHDLALRGTVVEPGMTTVELALAEAAIGANVPPELKLLWATGYPVGDGWPRWNSDPAGQAAEDRAWTERSFAFDIEANGFWMTDWGPRPNADKGSRGGCPPSGFGVALTDTGVFPPVHAHDA